MSAETTKAVNALAIAFLIAIQWVKSPNELVEMTKLHKVWFGYLDTLLDDDAISHTLFTFNHHALSHLPHLIKVLGSIRAVSARGLERKIGVVRRVVRSTNKAGVIAGNEPDQEDAFTFFEHTG